MTIKSYQVSAHPNGGLYLSYCALAKKFWSTLLIGLLLLFIGALGSSNLSAFREYIFNGVILCRSCPKNWFPTAQAMASGRLRCWRRRQKLQGGSAISEDKTVLVTVFYLDESNYEWKNNKINYVAKKSTMVLLLIKKSKLK